jgi:pyruvate dehydrogenase E2 component (dihydrolipoamide acetyltransferase)
MALFEYYLPELGEGIEEGEVIQILVAVGDSIVKDQPVIELETDKAVIEVPAPVDGNVKAIHFVIGDKVKVGQQLLSVETAEAEKPAASGIARLSPSCLGPRPTLRNHRYKQR